MSRELSDKSSVEKIRQRFDGDVERFSHLETGQAAAMDAVLILEIVARVGGRIIQPGGNVLDIGCGAGNFTLRLLQQVHDLNCILVDLSRPMLDRATERVSQATRGTVKAIQSDMRNLRLPAGTFNVILAGQTLHHLRDDTDWHGVFQNLHNLLKPGGVLLVADMVAFDDPAVQAVMLDRFAEHLEQLGGAAYRQKVLDYVDEEDSPRSVQFQFDVLRNVGFSSMAVLHQQGLFTAYYARR